MFTLSRLSWHFFNKTYISHFKHFFFSFLLNFFYFDSFKMFSFITTILVTLGKPWAIMGLRQTALISLKWGFLFGALSVDFSWGFQCCIKYIDPWSEMFSFNQCTYKAKYCNWILVQPCMDLCVNSVNVLYLMQVQYLLSIHSWDSSP